MADVTLPVPLKDVKITGGFWHKFMEKVRTNVIPYQWEALNDRLSDAEPSHCMKNFRIAAGKESGKSGGFVFQDSDLAKWIEAAAYCLMWYPDAELEKTVDGAIDDAIAAQQPDGYLNTYYIINGLDKRFTNLRDDHELYCLGHFIEGAVAYYQATGKDKLLNALIKYVDLVDSHIGADEGKIHGYPGHEEIELALVKLYSITKADRHLNLARYFIDERGKEPLFFEKEYVKYGRHPHWTDGPLYNAYYQAEEPVREQQHAVGHAVRAMYLYSGMADVALATDDDELLEACRRLWRDTTRRRMYITGGIGSSSYGEAFTYSYDLPNDTVYAETCASIGLAFFAVRMLNIEKKGEYADILEKVLYNGIISGMSADGNSFFYVNPLETVPEGCQKDKLRQHVKPERQKWFGCACCPPNLARLAASLGSYVYSKSGNTLFVNLFVSGSVQTELDTGTFSLNTTTDYPWDSKVDIQVAEAPDTPVSLAVHIPGWCKKYSILINEETADCDITDGYAYINRRFTAGDKICFKLDMPVVLMEANPLVREDIGKTAVMRGPVVYCVEEADNGKNLHELLVSTDTKFKAVFENDFFGGAVLIEAFGKRAVYEDDNSLYRPASKTEYRDTLVKWIPYYLWANRKAGEMYVWIKKFN